MCLRETLRLCVKPRFMRRFLIALFTIIVFQSALAQQSGGIVYIKEELMIPMRDGTKLFTRIYYPQNATSELPILLMRTPYSEHNMGTVYPDKDSYVKNMAAEGYIFVYQNIRGKQKSEGEFVMQRPTISEKNPNAIDESTDTYDTIDWLLKNLKGNNGKVGQLGISYPGWTSQVSASKPHPALKAASPQATMGDLFLGDDFHHNGAFRFSYGFEYSFEEEAAKGDTTFPFPQYDLYNWYLNVGSLANVNSKYFHHRLPTWNHFSEHPNYDTFWQHQSPLSYVDEPKIPTLHVSGYWDQEDIMGPQLLYNKMEKKDSRKMNYIILGPWYHGQWAQEMVDKIGRYEMGRNTGADFRELQKQWFDYWLKGKGDGKFDEAVAFQTGSNQWHHYSSWPPVESKEAKLYLREGGNTSFEAPKTDKNGFDRFVSDPAHPVPYRSRPIEMTYGEGSRWKPWLTEDQRFVHNRPDVLSWESAPLENDFTITGPILAHIFASTTGSDADWVVKLIDVYPDKDEKDLSMSQFQLMIASEVFRGRFRKSFSNPQPLVPGKAEEFVIDLHEVNHRFLKGHRIMVQVQSTWFPIIDRNPQRYVPNIWMAKESDFQKAVHTVYHQPGKASYLSLPVMDN